MARSKYEIQAEKELQADGWTVDNKAGMSDTYKAIHAWLGRNHAKPRRCSRCRCVKKLDWALVGKRHVRDIRAYRAMCRSCHLSMDRINRKSISLPCSRTGCRRKVERTPKRIAMNERNYCSYECYWKDKPSRMRGRMNANYRHGLYTNGKK